ncbi:signal transduction histidine kinase [Mucilaginibacter gracilis]|uniref:histidine kinase n=1 Tax=Mucilaginibacter gracilis TaxID=423350 RepID=A0A495IV25_9SPHI|nr:ATP-binding protein [Mucilaginibacter gracilis]RKR80323.1 signal transduction histidine kinase [Mucilaginibacter gracilis]
MNNALNKTIGLTCRISACILLLLLVCSCGFFADKNINHAAVLKPVNARANEIFNTDPEKALAYIETEYRLLPYAGPQDLYFKYDYYRKYYLAKNHNYTKALAYVDSMLLVLQPRATEKANSLLLAEAHLDRGDILFAQGKFNAAYLDYYEAKTTIPPNDPHCDNAVFQFDFYTRLANISYGQGRFLDAADFNKRALNALLVCYTDSATLYSVQGIFDNVGICYYKSGRLDSAEFYFHKALKAISSVHPKTPQQKMNADVARGVVLGNLGSVNFARGDIKLAEQRFEADISINSKPGYATGDALVTQVKLAELYVKTNQLPKAAQVLQQIKAAKDSLPEVIDKLQLIMLQASYANATGQPKQAYHLLQLYIAQKNALKLANINLMASDFSKEFELLRRQFDLQDLKKQNQLKSLYLFVAIITCLMAATILYLTFKSSRQARANAKQSALHNRQLEITLDALEISNHEHAHLMRVVAHDLKNPISAIYGISSLMTEDEGRTTEDIEMLELIKAASKNLDTLIYDLLAAKINKSVEVTKKANVDLSDLLKESVALLQYRAGEKKQKILFEEGNSCLVHINRDRVWRVLNNLIVNAVKFSPANTTIHVKWERDENEVRIGITDEGIGIPEELKSKIFQLSTDAKRQGTSGEEAFGLGLYISKQIIEEQGGKIWFESNAPKGTTFYFSLPLAQ